MSRRVVVALVVASTRRAHVRNARAPRRRPPPPRFSRDLLSSPRSRSDGRRASRRVRRHPRRGLPGRPGAPRDRAPRRAHGENREARRGKDRPSEGSARVRGFARGRVRGGDPRDAPARRRYVRKRPRAAPSAPPPPSPRVPSPPDPTRRVATVPLPHGSIEPDAILRDPLGPPDARPLAALRVDRHSSPPPSAPPPPSPDNTRLAPVSEGPGVLPGELPSDPPPRYPFFVTDDDRRRVPSFDWSDAKERRAALDRVRAHKPAVIRNARFADALVEALKGDDERKESAAAGGSAERSAAATRDGGGGGGVVSANVSKNPTSKAPPPPPPPPPALFRSLARHCESDATTRRCELSEASSASGLGRATAEPDAFADPSDPSEPSEGGVGSSAPRPRFSPPIDAKNHPGAHYRVRRPETSVAAVTVAEFARCASAWTSRGAYLNDQIAGERRNEAEEGGARAGSRSRGGGAGPSPLVLVDVGSRDRLALAPEVFRRKGRKGPRPDRSRTRRTDDPNGDPNAPEREDDFSSDDDSDGDADDSGAETRDGAPRAGLGRFVLDRADGDALAAFASTCGFGSLRSVFFCAGTRDGLVPLHHPTSAFAEHSAWDRNETDFSRLSKPSSSSSPDASSPPAVAVAPSFASSDYAPTAHDREGRKAAASAAAAAADDEGFEALQVQVLGRRRVVLVSPRGRTRARTRTPSRTRTTGGRWWTSTRAA